MTVKVQQFEMLTQAIQFAVQSHQVTGQNLANINTPGYKAKEVRFQELLDRVESKSSNPVAEFQVEIANERTMRNDGNTVDLDRELAALKKNALAFQTLTQLLGSKMGILKQAING